MTFETDAGQRRPIGDRVERHDRAGSALQQANRSAGGVGHVGDETIDRLIEFVVGVERLELGDRQQQSPTEQEPGPGPTQVLAELVPQVEVALEKVARRPQSLG